MPTELDTRALRRALAQFPTGVTVITTLARDGGRIGVTASSFNSVSMDPPLILWSVAKRAYSAKAFRDAEHFVVNVLGKQQVDISNKFACAGEDKFADVDCSEGVGGCPVLSDTAGRFECRTWNTYDGGDHIIVVGEVQSFGFSESVMPLVFSRGAYAVATPQPVGAAAGARFSPNGFLSSYLLYLLNQAHAMYAAELYPLLMSECGVTPEEWRILTLVADTESVSVRQLANLVMQPEKECRDCLRRLLDRNYLVLRADGQLEVKGNGSDLASKLFSLAKSHEQTVLESLDEDQRAHLSAGLAQMIAAFGHPAPP